MSLRPMSYRAALLAGAGLACTIGLSDTALAASDCSALSRLNLPSTRIQRAVLQNDKDLPSDPNSALTGANPQQVKAGAHCLIEGEIGGREGVGGHYGIHFQMRAPVKWNGRFLFQGGGGMDGFLAPAIGAIPSPNSSAKPALARGYAVVSMDGGHQGRDASFAQDQQARLDLAYASIGKVTDVAKALIHAFYGKEPKHSVFMGCSNGGREAMIAAQRYPTEFDGIVVGDPGFHLSAASLAQAWDVRELMAAAPVENGAPILSKALTQADLDLVSKAVIDACDGLDGVKDGLINAYRQCRFDPETLRGKLPDAKLDALKSMVAGPHGASGAQLYSDWPIDAGFNSPGWRAWKLGNSTTAQPDARNVVLGGDSLPHLFMTPRRETLDVTTLDFDEAARDVAQMGALNDATSTFMTSFVARGGKMVMFQGLSDPVFSASDIMRWYDKATSDTKGDFARLFMVPGMTHCGGGPALDDFDPLSALEAWTDTGTPPAEMPARGKSFPGVTQPLCPYPAETHYEGGDALAVTSYSCKAPD